MNDARKFLELHAEEWGTYSKHALATIHAKNDRKPELLPLTKDIRNLRSFLVTEINRIIDQLENRGKESQCHVSQSEFSSKIKLKQWINSDKWKRKEDIENIEHPMERLLAERLKIIYSKGKKKKKVPTLFTTELNKAISYLVKHRNDVGVLKTNIYLFPCVTRNSKNHIRGWEVFHDIALKAKLEKPNLITSTKIRKHMATVLQLLDMNNAVLEWVTEHLGHTPDVNKTWYRQEASTVELTKVAKLLIVKDNNVSFKNKKMRDITGIRFSCIYLFI